MSPILILHGALGSPSQLEPVKSALESRGLDVYCLSFSGHGGLPFHPEFGIDQFSEEVLVELDARKLSTVDIFGYSMGGYVALWLASNHPHRIGKIVTLGTKFDWSIESASQEIKKLNPEKILEKVPAFAKMLETRHAPSDWKELMRKTADMMMDLGKNPLLTHEVLKAISHETLICLGDQDDMADRKYSEEVANTLPHGKFLLLENTPHPIEKVSIDKLTDILLKAFN